MGLTLIKSDGSRVTSDELEFTFTTNNFTFLPKKRSVETEVPGRDGVVVHEDGYDNIIIDLACKTGSYNVDLLHFRMREISAAMKDTVQVIMDYAPNLIYTLAKSVSDIKGKIDYPVMSFAIKLECTPYPVSIIDPEDAPMLATTETTWATTDYYWTDEGHPRTFTIQNGSIELYNNGMADAKPIIKISGTASSVVVTYSLGSFTVTNIGNAAGDTVYIDCSRLIVYDENINNFMTEFVGTFPELAVGITTFAVNASSEVSIEFMYSDTFN